jgi:DNA-binding NtrC family response regulator
VSSRAAIRTTQAVIVIAATSQRREEVGRTVSAVGCESAFATPDEAFAAVEEHQPEIVVVVAGGPDPTEEIACLARMARALAQPRYVFLATVSSEDIAIRAFHAGASRYVRGPWTREQVAAAIGELLPQERPPTAALRGGERLVGRSEVVRQLREQLALVAPVTSNVLISGETGTGKELVAELIHGNSGRADKPFVCLNTAAVPDALVESELFGHERGSFTGAVTAHAGKLSAAHGGTAFLDEIGDVSLPVQAKLLRAIENKEVYRVGATRSQRLDVRILAATHRNLEQAVEAGTFRRDLYYRLNVVRVELPALRERADDVPLLIAHYIRHFNRELQRSIRGLSARAIETLRTYHWPGNIRELRNVIEAMMVNLSPETTGIVDLPPVVLRQLALAAGAPTSERERLLQALTATNWNKSKAASQLRVSRMTLYRKMHQHDVRLRK